MRYHMCATGVLCTCALTLSGSACPIGTLQLHVHACRGASVRPATRTGGLHQRSRVATHAPDRDSFIHSTALANGLCPCTHTTMRTLIDRTRVLCPVGPTCSLHLHVRATTHAACGGRCRAQLGFWAAGQAICAPLAWPCSRRSWPGPHSPAIACSTHPTRLPPRLPWRPRRPPCTTRTGSSALCASRCGPSLKP